MKRSFISQTINNGVRVWQIEYLENLSASVITYNYHDSANIETNTVRENRTAFNKRIKDKLKQGYVEVATVPVSLAQCKELIEKYSEDLTFKAPMKCQKYDPVKFQYPCLGQPKLNGLRCYIVWGEWVTKNGMFTETFEGAIALSQEGCRYHVPHVTDCFVKSDFCERESQSPTIYFDGELYVYGEQLNIIKSRVPIEINGKIGKASLPTEPIKFYCFDVAVEDDEYASRKLLRHSKLFHKEANCYGYVIDAGKLFVNVSPNKIQYVDDVVINNVEDAQLFTDACIAAGFEGAVLRTYDNVYKYGKRPQDILKIKRYSDGEFTVIDIIAKPKGQGCLFVCKNDINDAVFESTPMGTFVQQNQWLTDKKDIIGKQVTIKYYERSGVKKAPFHSNVLGVREYR